ncbi:MAG: hypothetical protein RRC07_05735 [Anaerolineae bacterium]|nr:hypothetical protein [Anaerolineae bacterium]
MNEQGKIALSFFFGVLLLATLACGVGGIDLPDVNIPEGAAATAGAAARGAATAAAEAGIQETVAAAAGTVVSGAEAIGGDAVATLQATDFSTEVVVDGDALRDKVESARPDASGAITVVLTDEELNRAVRVNPEADGQPAIEDISVQFTGGNVVLSGALTQPLATNLVATFSAAAVDGELELELERVTVAGLPLPSATLAPVETALNQELQRALQNLPDNYSVSSVVIGEGTMTVVATP